MKTPLYKDTESGELVSRETLSKEFDELKAEAPEEYDYTFEQYLNNACSKNGFLERVC